LLIGWEHPAYRLRLIMTRILKIDVLSGALVWPARLLTIVGPCSIFVFALSTAAGALDISTPHVNIPPPHINVPTPHVSAPSKSIPTVNIQKRNAESGGGGNKAATQGNTSQTVTVTPTNTSATATITGSSSNTPQTVTVTPTNTSATATITGSSSNTSQTVTVTPNNTSPTATITGNLSNPSQTVTVTSSNTSPTATMTGNLSNPSQTVTVTSSNTTQVIAPRDGVPAVTLRGAGSAAPFNDGTAPSSPDSLLQATQQMQEAQQSFNMQYLQLQASEQHENRQPEIRH
jgi:hypothetical protein